MHPLELSSLDRRDPADEVNCFRDARLAAGVSPKDAAPWTFTSVYTLLGIIVSVPLFAGIAVAALYSYGPTVGSLIALVLALAVAVWAVAYLLRRRWPRFGRGLWRHRLRLSCLATENGARYIPLSSKAIGTARVFSLGVGYEFSDRMLFPDFEVANVAFRLPIARGGELDQHRGYLTVPLPLALTPEQLDALGRAAGLPAEAVGQRLAFTRRRPFELTSPKEWRAIVGIVEAAQTAIAAAHPAAEG